MQDRQENSQVSSLNGQHPIQQTRCGTLTCLLKVVCADSKRLEFRLGVEQTCFLMGGEFENVGTWLGYREANNNKHMCRQFEFCAGANPVQEVITSFDTIPNRAQRKLSRRVWGKGTNIGSTSLRLHLRDGFDSA